MKTKRILAMVMAMIMTFVVFAIPASAVSGAFLKPIIGVEGGNTTVAAGDTVNITVAFESDATNNSWGGGLLTMGWDSSKVSFSGDFPTFSGAWDGVMSTTPAYLNTSSTALDGITWSADDQTKGYNSAFALFLEEANSYEIVDGQVVATFAFTVADSVAPGTEIYIGIADGMYAGVPASTYLTNAATGYDIYDDESEWNEADFGLASYDKSASYVKLTVAEEKIVFHKATQIQWADQANNVVNLGFKGYFNAADIAIDFGDDTTADNVSEVGAKITANGEQTKGTRWVYTPDNGTTYEFRAILPVDLDTDANTEITVEYYVVYNGQTYWSAPITTTASAHSGRLSA